MNLNSRGLTCSRPLLDEPAACGAVISTSSDGATIVDCGVQAPGSEAAGLLMARVCLAGLAEVRVVPVAPGEGPWPLVEVASEQPLLACIGSQYAGWQLAADDFFAMGSGPMRAAYGGEELLQEFGLCEEADAVIGVLESASLPGDAICRQVAEKCRVEPAAVTLLVAPTASPAGTCQVVARSLETALHKMHEIGFDLGCVVSGSGTAPLPPAAADDMQALGWTNDSVLYGADVVLWLNADDELIQQHGPAIPSNSSADHGRPFIDIFRQYDHDFYKIDPLLFSPARVSLISTRSGNRFVFGELSGEILASSFAASSEST
jgi:methenyltetrahydromethanopterin cyclohydrolase